MASTPTVKTPAIVWVDSRVGSKEFAPALRRAGLRVELATLGSADFMFEGQGPDGPVQIGVERKTLPDLLQSLRSGRLLGMATETSTGQVARMVADYDIIWLLVEGLYTSNKHGQLCARTFHGLRPLLGGMTEDSLTKTLLSVELQAGLHIKQTSGRTQSVKWLASLVRWWTDKAWQAHTTLTVVHQPMQPFGARLSLFRDIVLRLPGTGLAVSKALEHHCGGHLDRLLRATPHELSEICIQTPAGPRRLGARAAQIHEALRRVV